MRPFARAFFALPVPDDAQRALIAAQDRMKRVDVGRLPVRFTRTEQLHITLKFLGDVPREKLSALSALGARHAASCPALDLECTGLIAFGSVTRARALVAEITAHPALSVLARALEDAAAEHDVPREERKFRPHITLARIKRPGNAQALLDAADLAPLVVRCTELRCYESELGPDGGVYTVIGSTRLGAG